MVISQTLNTSMKNNNHYTLSGKIYINTSKKKEVKITVGNITNTITCEANTSKWYEIKMTFKPTSSLNTFKIEDYSTQNYDDASKQHTLLYHLKLELGQIATAWCQSTRENNYADKIYEYSKQGLSDALSQNAIFNALTNNGKQKGIYLTENGLYINASAIGTGLLRSNEVTGTFKYTSDDGNGNDIDFDEFYNVCYRDNFKVESINVTEGTLFNLQTGDFFASKFNLRAGTDKHIYLNSNPTGGDHYLDIGSNNDYIQFSAGGAVKISAMGSGSEVKIGNGELNFSAKDFCFYVENGVEYDYSSGDARLALREAAELWDNSDTESFKNRLIDAYNDKGLFKEVLSFITSSNGKATDIKDFDNEKIDYMKLRLYDINQDQQITASDARVILRKVAQIQAVNNLNLVFNKYGLSLTSTKVSGRKKYITEHFIVNGDGTYIANLYLTEGGLTYQKAIGIEPKSFLDKGEYQGISDENKEYVYPLWEIVMKIAKKAGLKREDIVHTKT